MSSSIQRFAIIVLIMAMAAATELWMGRQPWGVRGEPGIWSGDIWSAHNSQYLTDPSTFTHVTHGLVFYSVLSLTNNVSLGTRLVATVGLESAWEVLENSDSVIQRYRKATISLNYFGDSIMNSMCDVLACMFGFLLASRLPKRGIVATAVALEILLAIFIRDNLTLNIIMLLVPNRAIRIWQLGK